MVQGSAGPHNCERTEVKAEMGMSSEARANMHARAGICYQRGRSSDPE